MPCPVVSSSVLTLSASGAMLLLRDLKLRAIWFVLLAGNLFGWGLYYWLNWGSGPRVALEIVCVLSLLACVMRVFWLHWVEALPLPGAQRLKPFSGRLQKLFANPVALLLKGLLLGVLLISVIGIVPGARELALSAGVLLLWVCLLLIWRQYLAERFDRFWLYNICQLSWIRGLLARRHANIRTRRQWDGSKNCPFADRFIPDGVDYEA